MTEDMMLEPAAVRRLTGLLRASQLIESNQSIDTRLISGGRSNLTYGVDAGKNSWVLRRPPLGPVLSTAHDMSREYRVLTGLGGGATRVPVPQTVLFSDDADIIGAPFYLMERVEGSVLRTAEQALSLSPADQERVSEQLIETLADLHDVDAAAVGLADFGRPAGFMTRQVKRWSRQPADSSSRHIVGIDALASDLAASVPRQRDWSIVHGDYRLDNCLVRDGAVVAVLDWEMSTLGDPLSDIGLFAVYHAGMTDMPNPVVQSPGGLGSYPELEVLLDRYALRTGRDLDQLDWYIAFAWFKFAVILEGIHYRSSAGVTVGDEFEGVSDLVQPSVERGRAALADRARHL